MSFTRNSRDKRALIILGIMFVVIPILLFINEINIKNRMDTQTYSNFVTYKKTYSKNSDGHTSWVYQPIYHYEVYNKNYSCYGTSASSFRTYKNKPVYYRAENPSDCYVDNSDSNFIFYAVFFIAGIYLIKQYLDYKNKFLNKI